MKKQVIAVMMSIAVTMGSLGGVSAMAAETTAQTAVLSQEAAEEEPEKDAEETEDAAAGITVEESPEEESVQEDEVSIQETGETAVESETVHKETENPAEAVTADETASAADEEAEAADEEKPAGSDEADVDETGIMSGVREPVDGEQVEVVTEEIEEATAKEEKEAAVKINATEVDLYTTTEEIEKVLPIPSGYLKTFQIEVTGLPEDEAVTYSVNGTSVLVSEDGLIRPHGISWTGTSEVLVYAGKETFTVTVHVYYYPGEYAGDIMDAYLEENIKSGMSNLEKLHVIAAFPAQYDYSVEHSYASSMIIFGGGNCWASSDAIGYLCEKAGFRVRAVNFGRDSSLHMNCVVYVDGKTYMLEAGYDAKAPRPYDVTELDQLFGADSNGDGTSKIVSYAGEEENVVIPSEINGEKITGIGHNVFFGVKSMRNCVIPEGVAFIEYGAFGRCKNLESVTIPSSLKRIGNECFNGCEKLTDIDISSVEEIGSGAFSHTGLKSIRTPEGIETIGEFVFFENENLARIDIAAGVKKISQYAICHNGLTQVNFLGNALESIDDCAFEACHSLRDITFPDGIKSIGAFALSGCTALERVTVPDSVTEIGTCAFGDSDTEVNVRFRGTKEQWERACAKGVHYKSITFNCFSVPIDCSLSGTVFTYAGKEIRPEVSVSYEGNELIEGVDYEVAYRNCDCPGKATADIIGIGKYSGTEPLDYCILPCVTKKVTCTNVASGIKVSWEKVEGATSYYVYRDDKYLFRTSALAVTDKEVKYNLGEKYVYKVVATTKGAGDSLKARTATTHRLMPVKIYTLSNPAAGKMTVSYDYRPGGSGYVVRFGLNSDMSDAKVITVKGDQSTVRTFGGMKKGKTYYVQVRTYLIENGIRYYSG